MTLTDPTTYITELTQTCIKNEAEKAEQDGRMPLNLINELVQHGFLRQAFPKALGGLGESYPDFLHNIQRISTQFVALASVFSTQVSFGLWPIAHFGTPRQQEVLLAPMFNGELWSSLAYSEANSGSHLAEVQTKALETEDYWLLSGTKDTIANATLADLFLVVARVETPEGDEQRGIFLVPRDTPGLTVNPLPKEAGIRGLPLATLTLTDVKIAKDNVLGGELKAEHQVPLILNHIRLGIAAKSLGLAQGAFRITIDYATQKRKFGLQLIDSQEIQREIAEIGTGVETTQTYFDQIVQRPLDDTVAIAKLKLVSSTLAEKAAKVLTQITGGYGYLQNNHIERYARDARATTLYGGSANTQRKQIFQRWLKRTD